MKREPTWIEEREALAIHDQLLALHGGAAGVRDLSMLSSALARPRQHHAHGASSGIGQLAALYTAGIVRSHPFVDGNKRTGFVVGVLFLELNGFNFRACEEDATQAVLELAAGRLDEKGYSAWLHANATSRARR